MPKKYRIKDWVQIIGKPKLKELRDAAISSKLKRPLWIRSRLDDNQIAEIYYRIFEKNESLESIAKKAKYAWGIHPDWKTQQFVRGLETWVKRLKTTVTETKKEIVTVEGKAALKRQREKLSRLSKEVNALGRLGWLVDLQTERVLMFRELEIRSKLPSGMADGAVRTLMDLCSRYADTAVKTGVLEGVPSEVNVNIKGQADIVFSKFVENDGKKMIQAGNKLLTKLEQYCVSMVLDEKTGNYVEAKDRKEIAEVDMTEEIGKGIIRE